MISKLLSCIFATLLFVGPASATDAKLKRYDIHKKKMVEVTIANVEGLRVSKNCGSRKNPKCMALKALGLSPSSSGTSSIPLVGHPAAKLCRELGGNGLLFLDPKKIEIDYCVFKDESFINSWDLYYAVNKN